MDGTNTSSLGISTVMTIVVWSSFALLVVGCLLVGRSQMHVRQGPATGEKEAVERLRRRLASGKIDDEEYVRRRFELQSR
jgi:uncharacterized membrane protein